MIAVHAGAVEAVARSQKDLNSDQVCMFDAAELAPMKPEIPELEDDRRETLEWEKETLGLYVLGPPAAAGLVQAQKAHRHDGIGSGPLPGTGPWYGSGGSRPASG